MKRTVIIAAFAAAFGSTFATAEQMCVGSDDGLYYSCTDVDTPAQPEQPKEPVVYPTGQMPRDSNSPAIVDKVNFLDDATIAHRKSIGNLYNTKVDKDVFEADQKRQDDAMRDIDGKADNANRTADNSYKIGNQAHAIASEANENSGIAMNMADDAKQIGTDAKQIGTDAKMQADHATSETEKLWKDKASKNDVNEVRGALADESSERIKNDALESQERIKNDALESQERIKNDAIEAQQRIAGYNDLESRKANRGELNAVASYSDANARSYADTAERNANAYTDEKIKGVESDLANMAKQNRNTQREARAGVAGAAAMANIPTAQEIGRLTVGAGAGFYKDAQAVAVGASYRFDNRVTLKGSVSTTGRDTAAGAGVSYAL